MTSFDAIIVGGGPAGSSCAWRLTQAGKRVLVIDKQAFPRVKPCAGWITPQVIQSLQIDVDTYRRDFVFQPITGFRTSLIDGPEVQTTYSEPVSFGIRRCEFDDYLLRRSGAEIEFQSAKKLAHRENAGWVVNDSFETPLLIGAGGHFCPVAKQLGNRQEKQSSVVVAQEVEFEMSPEQQARVTISGNVPELFFCNDLSGYGWCFRKGNFLNVGLGRIDRRQLSMHVNDFCNFLKDKGKVSFELSEKFLGHAYQLYQGVQGNLYDDGVLLIGDAAGLAYSHSGEGIRPAVESGLIAAATICELDGNYDHRRLASYQERLTARLGRSPANKSSWLPDHWQRKVATRLFATRWFTRRIVIENWFLHRHQVALEC